MIIDFNSPLKDLASIL